MRLPRTTNLFPALIRTLMSHPSKRVRLSTTETRELSSILDSDSDWEFTLSSPEPPRKSRIGAASRLMEKPMIPLFQNYKKNSTGDSPEVIDIDSDSFTDIELENLIKPKMDSHVSPTVSKLKPLREDSNQGNKMRDTAPRIGKIPKLVPDRVTSIPSKPLLETIDVDFDDSDEVLQVDNDENVEDSFQRVNTISDKIDESVKAVIKDLDTYSSTESPTRSPTRSLAGLASPTRSPERSTSISKGADWGGKIALQTQIGYSDHEKLHLPENTKIKVPIYLSREQESIIDLANKGYNIFYTGSAGTGKSVLLREIIKKLKFKYGHEEVAVTASTGLAACNIGGITVHSFSGIGLGRGEANTLYKKVRRSKQIMERWQKIKALVIDEISMLDGELLDKLDFIAQKIRKSHKPFGGVQLIFCGDFFQLPPVVKQETDANNRNITKQVVFAFESRIWKQGIQMSIVLQKVFRQQGDLKFIDMLNEARLGKMDLETEKEFQKLARPLPKDDIEPAELYSTRYEVDNANMSRLNKLPGKIHIYESCDGGTIKDPEHRNRLLLNFLAPKTLKLKVGAQVMMIKNIDSTLVNGSLGKVIDFIDRDTYMFYQSMDSGNYTDIAQLESLSKNREELRRMYEEEEDEFVDANNRRQNITKKAKNTFLNQNHNLSEQVTPLSDSIFEFLDNVKGKNAETQANIARKKQLLQDLHMSSNREKLPLVRFKTADLSSRTVLVEPEQYLVEDEKDQPLVSRTQLPLMLAWSLSIHKSQGQTLPKVKIDLRRVFEKGQAYVALSRAVSREGLQVLNFDRNKINTHEKVVEFYNTLNTVDDAMRHISSESNSDTDAIVDSGSLQSKNSKFQSPLRSRLQSNASGSLPQNSTRTLTQLLKRQGRH